MLTNHLPRAPGAYVLRDGQGRALLVGGAGDDVRRRVRDLFSGDHQRDAGPALRTMRAVEHVACGSVLEAAVAEMRLAHAVQPRHPQGERRTGQRYVRLDGRPAAPTGRRPHASQPPQRRPRPLPRPRAIGRGTGGRRCGGDGRRRPRARSPPTARSPAVDLFDDPVGLRRGHVPAGGLGAGRRPLRASRRAACPGRRRRRCGAPPTGARLAAPRRAHVAVPPGGRRRRVARRGPGEGLVRPTVARPGPGATPAVGPPPATGPPPWRTAAACTTSSGPGRHAPARGPPPTAPGRRDRLRGRLARPQRPPPAPATTSRASSTSPLPRLPSPPPSGQPDADAMRPDPRTGEAGLRCAAC